MNRLSFLLPWLAFFASLFVLETLLFWMLLSGMPWGVVLAGHLFLCLGVLLFLFSLLRRGKEARFVAVGIIFIATMGPFGALMMLFLLFFYGIFLLGADPLTTLLEAIFPKITEYRGQQVSDRIIFGLDSFSEEMRTLPLIDIMHFGTEKQKMAAINKMMRYYKPEFIPALKRALDDPSNAVRVLAGTAVAEIEAKLHEEFLQRQKAVQKEPGNWERLLQFADFCKKYSEMSFIDIERNKTLRAEALKCYLEYLQVRLYDNEVKLSVAPLLMESERYEEAEKLLLSLYEFSAEYRREAYRLLMDLYFQQGHFEKMRTFTQERSKELLPLIDSADPLRYEELLFVWGMMEGENVRQA